MARFSLVKAFSWPQPNLGQAYIAAAARRSGHEVQVVDTTFWRFPPNRHSGSKKRNERVYGASAENGPQAIERICSALSSFSPDVVGLSLTSFNADGQLLLAKRIKEALPGVKIIVGGAEPTLRPDIAASHAEFDAVCIGEGEESIPEYLTLCGRGNQRSVPGIWARCSGGSVPKSHVGQFVRNLDSLPFPDWEGWPVQDYVRQYFLRGSLPVLASRGCPFQCTFCSSPVLNRILRGAYFRLRSPKNVIKEISGLRERYRRAGFKAVTFLDDTFGAVRPHFLRLVGLYRETGLHHILPWDCQTRPDIISREWASEARRSGCIAVRIGVEHGIESIRNVWYRRNISDTAIRSAVRNLKDEGILVVANLIVGGPFETRETLRQSLRFTKRLGTEFITLSQLYPLPSTELAGGLTGNGRGASLLPPRTLASEMLSEDALLKEYLAACKSLTLRQCRLALRRLDSWLVQAALRQVADMMSDSHSISTYTDPQNTTIFRFIANAALEQYLHQQAFYAEAHNTSGERAS